MSRTRIFCWRPLMIDNTFNRPLNPSNGPDHAAGPAGAGHIQIDPECGGLVRRHAPEEREQLEANVLAAGRCRDPLVRWKGHEIRLDGHERHPLCRKHNLPFTIIEVELPDRGAAL